MERRSSRTAHLNRQICSRLSALLHLLNAQRTPAGACRAASSAALALLARRHPGRQPTYARRGTGQYSRHDARLAEALLRATRCCASHGSWNRRLPRREKRRGCPNYPRVWGGLWRHSRSVVPKSPVTSIVPVHWKYNNLIRPRIFYGQRDRDSQGS